MFDPWHAHHGPGNSYPGLGTSDAAEDERRRRRAAAESREKDAAQARELDILKAQVEALARAHADAYTATSPPPTPSGSSSDEGSDDDGDAAPAPEAEYARAETADSRARAESESESESESEDGDAEPEVVAWMREALATYDGQDRRCPGEFVAQAKEALDAFDAGGADCGDCDHNECAQSVRQENGDGDDEEGSDRRTTLGDDQVVGNMRIAGARAWKDMDCTCAGLCDYEGAVDAWAMNGFRCERVFDLRQRASRVGQDRRGHGDGGGGGGEGGGKRQRRS